MSSQGFNSMLEEVINIGFDEKLRRERKFFFNEVIKKVETLAEANLDRKELAKQLIEFLNEEKLRLTINDQIYF